MSAESIEPNKDEVDVFSFQGKKLTQAEYLGDTGFGPVGEQFVKCPTCSAYYHKFSIRCHECGTVIREIGKIDTGPRGSAAKGVAFVVAILVFGLSALVLTERSFSGGRSLAVAIPLALGGLLLWVNGLLGVLYFRYFVGVTFLKGLMGFGVGAVSVLLGVACLLILI